MSKALDSIATDGNVNQEQVWVIVPAYNESDQLGQTLELLCQKFPNVVVVDDGSTDSTSAVSLRFSVFLLRHSVNCGQGAALQTGIDFALQKGAEILVTFDADGQHCVEDIEPLIEPIRTLDSDIVFGSRFLGTTEGLPWTRWIILKLGVFFTGLLSGMWMTDTHNGLRAFSRHAAQKIRITISDMAHASEIIDQVRRQGLSYCEVPVTVKYNPKTIAKGQSSWNSLRIAISLVLQKFVR